MQTPTADHPSDDLVLCEVTDHVATLTIHRPEALNAMNRHVMSRLRERLDEVATRDDVELIVFTGHGEKSFVAGADIHELARRTPTDGLRGVLQGIFDQVEQLEKPTIAAVNGYAFGGGTELALACDIRIASTCAQFALPETTYGILPGAGGSQRLARLVGLGRATEMILTGRRVRAEEALTMGLVTSVVAPESLAEEVRSTADRILSKGPLATRLAKLVVRHGINADHSTGMLLERLATSVLYASPQRTEGTQAFIDKRDADFRSVDTPPETMQGPSTTSTPTAAEEGGQ